MKKIILLLTVVSLFTFGFLQTRRLLQVNSSQELQSNDYAIAENEKPVKDLSKIVSLQEKGIVALPTDQPGKVSISNKSAKKKVITAPRREIPLHKKTEFTPAEMRELQRARKLARRKNGYAKSDKPDEYAKFHRLIRTKEGAKAPAYQANYKLIELQAAQQFSNARKSKYRTTNLNWSERGPANVPGRTRGLILHPDNPQRIWFAGSVGGGIWKTTDAGANWVNKTPNLPNLATTVLAMAPSNSAIIYAGTGEGFFNADAVNGDGIFKSSNGGETWQQLSATDGDIKFRNINRIIVDPSDPNIVVACSNIGFIDNLGPQGSLSWIMRSTDGGSSWSTALALPNPYRIQQLVVSPGNFDVQYATVNGLGVVKSTDAGLTWVLANKGMFPGGRVEMAIAPTNPSRLYASAEGSLSGNGSDLYISDDAGANWQLVLEDNNQANINWLGGQGWYDNTITVHPYDQNTIYLGGVQLWKMIMQEGEGTKRIITNVEEINTQSFLDFTNTGGAYFGGKLVIGNVPDSEYVSVEIRFGTGQSQKAHRFTVDGRGPGVPAQDYEYQNYVDIPFEVWDITNNRQLMVSFRDQQEDGEFNLLEPGVLPDSTPIQRREYIYIHTTTYAASANDSIAQNGGHQYKNLYFLWPILKDSATWNPDNLPDSKLVINTGTTRLRITQNISDSYGQYGGKNSYVHPDHHNLIPIRVDTIAKTFKILNANDGGVYVSKPSTDPGYAQGSWIAAGNGYNTSQFYGVDKKRDADEYIGGTQDNGTWRSAPLEPASAASSYLFQLGGDGFETSWNYFNPNKIIGGSQNNGFGRTLNGGATWSSATNGLTDVGAGSPFISQIAASKSNPDVLYAIGASGVWISDDFGGNWKLSPITDFWNFNGLFSDIKVSEANSSIIWAGNALSATGRLHVSIDGGQTFTPSSTYTDVLLGSVSAIATHPTEDSTAYALFSFSDSPKILRTTDLGQTWEDISGFGTDVNSSTGFPDVAVYSLLVMPNNPDIIWAGTEIGLVESTDGGATWALAQNGLPAVSIWELKVVDDQVVVATHGRGIWSVTIPELYQPVVFVPYINNLSIATSGNLAINASLRSLYDSTVVYINNTKLLSVGATSVKDTSFQLAYATEGVLIVQLKSYIDGKEYVSTAKTIEFFVAEVAYSYKNSFDSTSTDFFGNGFSVKVVSGFADGAVHSPHPYLEGQNYTYQLKKPIVVAEEDATFSYKDVAIVEPGEPGAPFGSAEFWDYVIVEGTKDGVNWIPLEDGYDANYNAKWRATYDDGLPGNDSLFVNHTLNILDTFEPNDTVFFRFRLYSDAAAIGWGWAIDDLFIQEDNNVIGSFTLVDANTALDIQTITEGDTINLIKVGSKLNIRANAMPDTVGSVVFELDGKVYRKESKVPYTLAGDKFPTPQYTAWTPTVGTHVLKATPYSEANGTGNAGKSLTVNFTVIKANEVANIILVNAETGQDIDTLQNGDVIDLQQVGTKLNIRAGTLPLLVGSVVFNLDGQNRTENFFPYAYAGFNYLRLKYNSWTPPTGNHTLTATPYSSFDAKGTMGISSQVSFSVIDGSDSLTDDNSPVKLVAYPNPGNGKFVVDLKTKDQTEVIVHIYDLRGNQVYEQKSTLLADNSQLKIDISSLPKGMYFMKAVSDKQSFEPLHIRKQ